MTNAERIHAMRDEELAEWLIATGCCPPGVDVEELCFPDATCNQLDLGRKCWLNWLKQEAQE